MRAKIKQARRKASKLHGASAGFVSLVDRGANETPFKMVKAAEGIGAMAIKKRNEQKSHKKISTGTKAAPAAVTKSVIAKMVFDQDFFEDEDAVREALEKAEWDAEGVVITDDGQGNFVARPDGTDDSSYIRIDKVDTEEEGVEAYVGKIEVKASEDADDDEDEDADEDDEDEDDEEEVAKMNGKKKKPYKDEAKDEDKSKEAKSAPVTLSKRAAFIAKAKASVAKFSGWDAYYSKENTLVQSLKAGMEWDSTPPGFYEVQLAFNGTVSAIFADEALTGSTKQEALNKAAMDYADLIGGLDAFFDSYINADEDIVKKSVEAEDARAKLAKWAEGHASFIASEGNDVGPASVKKAAIAPAPEGVAIDYKRIEQTVADLVKKAVEPVTEQVQSVSGTIQKLADRRPTKKAADLSDSPNGERKVEAPTEKKQSTAEWLLEKQRKAMIAH